MHAYTPESWAASWNSHLSITATLYLPRLLPAFLWAQAAHFLESRVGPLSLRHGALSLELRETTCAVTARRGALDPK